MRRSRCSTLIGALLALLPRAVGAQQTGPAEGAAFLLLPVGARATALGQAAVAEGGTTESVFWNPAGLAEMRRSELALHHYLAFFGTGDAVVVAIPTSALGVFAVAGYLVDYGDLDVTTSLGGPPIGRISPRNVELAASYATPIAGGLSAGITYKLVQFRVDCSGDCSQVPTAVGTTHAFDVGVRFAMPGRSSVIVGAAIRNLGFDLQVNNEAQADPLPTRLVVGAEAVVRRPQAGVDGLDVKVLADLQSALDGGSLAPTTLVGVESGVRDVIRFRAGYSFLDSSARGPSVGFGLKLGRANFDLARTFYNDQVGDQEPLHVSFRLGF